MKYAQNSAPRSKSNAGFALIEVLVGLTILAIGLLSATHGVGNGAETQLALSQRLMALWSVDNALMEMRISRAWPELGVSSFTCPQGIHIFVCQQKIFATPNPDFRRVEIVAYLSSSDGSGITSGPRLAWLVAIVPNFTGGAL